MRRRILAVIALALTTGNCIPEDGFQLDIPFRRQEHNNYCAVATILMWRLYDGLPSIAQSSIYSWMRGTTNLPNITAAVKYFTYTRDVYWDSGTHSIYREMAARQITAFDRQVPSIVAVHFDHAVIVTGGSWHTEGGYRIWDSVYAHDPGVGPHLYYTAGDWIREFCPFGSRYCDQVISQSATYDWHVSYQHYGDSVRIYGWDRDLGGPREY